MAGSAARPGISAARSLIAGGSGRRIGVESVPWAKAGPLHTPTSNPISAARISPPFVEQPRLAQLRGRINSEPKRRLALRLGGHARGAGVWTCGERVADTSTGHAARNTGAVLSDRNERIEVDPGRNPHSLEHPDEVLGRDVAGCAGREGAAAEPAEGGVE